jgi:hypothetical protein
VDRFDDAAAQADRQRSRFKAPPPPPPPPHIEPYSTERLPAQHLLIGRWIASQVAGFRAIVARSSALLNFRSTGRSTELCVRSGLRTPRPEPRVGCGIRLSERRGRDFEPSTDLTARNGFRDSCALYRRYGASPRCDDGYGAHPWTAASRQRVPTTAQAFVGGRSSEGSINSSIPTSRSGICKLIRKKKSHMRAFCRAL